jgi:hypothetical protein
MPQILKSEARAKIDSMWRKQNVVNYRQNDEMTGYPE